VTREALPARLCLDEGSRADVTMMIYAHSGMTEQTEALGGLGDAFGATD
jgi:hypothetical protein